MATSLTAALGTSEIKVGLQPRQMQRVYHGFAGVNGLTVMDMGSRGYALPVVGRLRVQGISWAVRRTAMINAVATLESLQAATATDYTYGGDTYANCIVERLRLLPLQDGRVFVDMPRQGQMTCEFSLVLRGLI